MNRRIKKTFSQDVTELPKEIEEFLSNTFFNSGKYYYPVDVLFDLITICRLEKHVKNHITENEDFSLGFFKDIITNKFVDNIFLTTTPVLINENFYFKTFEPYAEELKEIFKSDSDTYECRKYLRRKENKSKTFSTILVEMMNYVDISRNKRLLDGVYSSAQKRKLPEPYSLSPSVIKDRESIQQHESIDKSNEKESSSNIQKEQVDLNSYSQYSQFHIFEKEANMNEMDEKVYSNIDSDIEDYHKLFYSSLSTKEPIIINNKEVTKIQIETIKMIKRMTEILIMEFPEFWNKEEFLATNILGKLSFDINDIFSYLKDKETNQKLIWTDEEDRLLIGNRNIKKLLDTKGKDRLERRRKYLKPKNLMK